MKNRIETRRILLLVPLFILPLLIGTFYALGGGSPTENTPHKMGAGINTKLPDAKFTGDTLTDKMSIYDHSKVLDTTDEIKSLADRFGFGGPEDPQTSAIEEKLAMLNREMARPSDEPKSSGNHRPSSNEVGITRDVEKLESLMKGMQNGNAEDAEMKQLGRMLESIQEIQNPDIARMKYRMINKVAGGDSLFAAIPAIIEGNQKAVQGSVVKLKLLDSATLNGQLVPKGHLVYGLAAFSNQRLNLEITNIRIGTSIVPVNLTVFDMRDSMIGINAPEAILSDALNGGVLDAAGSIGVSGFDLTTQIAGAGIDAARSLLTKKIKRIKQPLKGGYPVLLRDNTKKPVKP